MDTRDYFIKAIDFLLKEKKKTRAEIVRFMNVDPPQITSFMNKKINFSESKREKIADFFNKEYIDMLIMGKNIAEKNKPYDETTKKDTEINQDIVTKFSTPEEGVAANQALLKIEKFNKKLFYRTVGDLKYMAEKLEEGIEPEPLIENTPTITQIGRASCRERV